VRRDGFFGGEGGWRGGRGEEGGAGGRGEEGGGVEKGALGMKRGRKVGGRGRRAEKESGWWVENEGGDGIVWNGVRKGGERSGEKEGGEEREGRG